MSMANRSTLLTFLTRRGLLQALKRRKMIKF
jgi:hypothetical protein